MRGAGFKTMGTTAGRRASAVKTVRWRAPPAHATGGAKNADARWSGRRKRVVTGDPSRSASGLGWCRPGRRCRSLLGRADIRLGHPGPVYIDGRSGRASAAREGLHGRSPASCLGPSDRKKRSVPYGFESTAMRDLNKPFGSLYRRHSPQDAIGQADADQGSACQSIAYPMPEKTKPACAGLV